MSRFKRDDLFYGELDQVKKNEVWMPPLKLPLYQYNIRLVRNGEVVENENIGTETIFDRKLKLKFAWSKSKWRNEAVEVKYQQPSLLGLVEACGHYPWKCWELILISFY